jgi:hypothetical protein
MAIIAILALGRVASLWLAAQLGLPWWAWLILAALAGAGVFAWRQREALR